MSPTLRIDVGSSVPPFEQIRGQVAGLIASGALSPGDRLPTVRDLASDLGVAVGTVQRAYRELEAAGLLTSRRRHGTTVAQGPSWQSRPDDDDADLREQAAALGRRAKALGLTEQQLTDLVRAAFSA